MASGRRAPSLSAAARVAVRGRGAGSQAAEGQGSLLRVASPRVRDTRLCGPLPPCFSLPALRLPPRTSLLPRPASLSPPSPPPPATHASPLRPASHSGGPPARPRPRLLTSARSPLSGQRHIRVGKQIVNIPSFMVRTDSQKHIDFAVTSPYGGGRPGRNKRKSIASKGGGGGGGDDEEME